MSPGKIAMIIALVVSSLATIGMILVALRYLTLNGRQKAALRSDPRHFTGLSRGENVLRILILVGLFALFGAVPWWPSRDPAPEPVNASDVPFLLAIGAVAWTGIAALLLRRFIYKRWI